jgi:hypothetical protein
MMSRHSGTQPLEHPTSVLTRTYNDYRLAIKRTGFGELFSARRTPPSSHGPTAAPSRFDGPPNMATYETSQARGQVMARLPENGFADYLAAVAPRTHRNATRSASLDRANWNIGAEYPNRRSMFQSPPASTRGCNVTSSTCYCSDTSSNSMYDARFGYGSPSSWLLKLM